MIELRPLPNALRTAALLALADGFYYSRQERGYGVQVTVIGPMPHTPQEFEEAVTLLMGVRYEITLAAGYEAPEGVNEQEFLRRGYWRMVFFPSTTVHRAESESTPRRPPRRRGTPPAATLEAQAAGNVLRPPPGVFFPTRIGQRVRIVREGRED